MCFIKMLVWTFIAPFVIMFAPIILFFKFMNIIGRIFHDIFRL